MTRDEAKRNLIMALYTFGCPVEDIRERHRTLTLIEYIERFDEVPYIQLDSLSDDDYARFHYSVQKRMNKEEELWQRKYKSSSLP
jgi:hypothetical protein